MRILAIETSCDETAIALIDASGNPKKNGVNFSVLSNLILSQVKLHAKYGGVFPSLAKREHAKNLIPVLKQVLRESNLLKLKNKKERERSSLTIPVYWNSENKLLDKIKEILNREPKLLEQFIDFIPRIKKPDIDAIAVTYGPGLEPALWVGINFAKALSLVWNVPIIPINHMEGHIFSALLKKSQNHAEERRKPATYNVEPITFPVLALLISGGHTELVLIKKWLDYKIIGETKDDAAGEAFDKVARMLGLPYPGGPAIAMASEKYAEHTRNAQNLLQRLSALSLRKSASLRLPRPMLDSGDYNFSFSGLKTAVLYRLKEVKKLTPTIIQEFCHEFENAVTDVLVSKTIKAAQKYGAKTIIGGGGVSANQHLREVLKTSIPHTLSAKRLYIAPLELTGDNALMIATAGYIRSILDKNALISPQKAEKIIARGTLRLL